VRWRAHGEHHAVQAQGRAEVFGDYHLRVGAVVADTAPPAGSPPPDAGGPETAAPARFASLTEFSFGAAGSAEDRHRAVAGWLEARAAGGRPAAHDLLESITTAGKVAVLAAWTGAAGAQAWAPPLPAGAAAWRHRVVRVLRDYGMFDRQETPQYHPPVARR
jgi:heme-degrading monooxygenase HmoA